MSYIDLLRESVESYSGGTITLDVVPDTLRASRESVAALACDMRSSIAGNNNARSASMRNAARTSTR